MRQEWNIKLLCVLQRMILAIRIEENESSLVWWLVCAISLNNEMAQTSHRIPGYMTNMGLETWTLLQ